MAPPFIDATLDWKVESEMLKNHFSVDFHLKLMAPPVIAVLLIKDELLMLMILS